MPQSRIRILGTKDRGNGRFTVTYLIFAPCFCSYERFIESFDKEPSEEEKLKAIRDKHGDIN